MRLLIISDVHGNLAALEAVLAAEPRFDRVVFAGDAVDYGPDPAGCLRALSGLHPIRVRGNHDNAAGRGVECGCSEAFRELSRASRRHTRSVLEPADLETLANLPLEARFDLDGAGFYVTHATPRDNLFEYASPDRDPEQWAAAMSDPVTDVIIVGHTHRPYVRDLGRAVVVNPGSVGQPRDGDPRAAYATWEDGRVALRRTPYDLERTRRDLARTGLPDDVVDALRRILASGGRI